jgi:hypothetical protein
MLILPRIPVRRITANEPMLQNQRYCNPPVVVVPSSQQKNKIQQKYVNPNFMSTVCLSRFFKHEHSILS